MERPGFPVVPNFYPRSPCGERPDRLRPCHHRHHISIHALLAESDPTCGHLPAVPSHFYPRSPCGERHRPGRTRRGPNPHFYPRSPCGERREQFAAWFDQVTFLSTLSLRRATSSSRVWARAWIFLSTLSLRRATGNFTAAAENTWNFYPRSPCGERPFRPRWMH